MLETLQFHTFYTVTGRFKPKPEESVFFFRRVIEVVLY